MARTGRSPARRLTKHSGNDYNPRHGCPTRCAPSHSQVGRADETITMRAMRPETIRGYEELKLVDLPKPAVTDGKVLVRMTLDRDCPSGVQRSRGSRLDACGCRRPVPLRDCSQSKSA